MAISKGGIYTTNRTIKKTRQGLGRGTKWGNKNSKKHYKKKPRGQGGKRH